MIAVWAVVLAIAGAPPHSTFVCDPQLVSSFGAYGLADISNSKAYLGATACGALLVSTMSASERRATQKLNSASLGWVQGEGLLIALHEARHLIGETNECRVEKFALANVSVLIDRFVSRPLRHLAMRTARIADSRLGAEYHGC